MEPLRIGIIGVGWPGQRHIEAYQKHPRADKVALSDVNVEAAERVKVDYSVTGARVCADYQELLAADDVDAVSICTLNFLHATMAIDALQAGKHVLLEKPLAHTLADGERVADEVARHPDLGFMIAFNNRYRPDSIVLKQHIDAGELGRIYYAKTGWLRGASGFFLSGWFTQRDRSGRGPLIDLGVHMLDLTLWLMGNPRPVSVSGSVYHEFNDVMHQSTGTDVDVEDLASAFVKLDNSATVLLDVSWLSHIEESDLIYTQLFGSGGGATIRRGPDEDFRIVSASGRGTTRTTVVSTPKLPAWDASEPGYQLYASFRAEIADFVDSVQEGRQPGATITHGLDILRVLDGIYRSAETGRETVLVDAVDEDHIESGDVLAPT